MEKRFLKRSHITLALHKSYLTTAQHIALFNYLKKHYFNILQNLSVS
jgi:hypothetical protein